MTKNERIALAARIEQDRQLLARIGMEPAAIVAWLLARCTPTARGRGMVPCQVWRLDATNGINPKAQLATWSGSARKLMLVASAILPKHAGDVACVRCENPLCMERQHLRWLPRKVVNAKNAPKLSTPARNARIALKMRALPRSKVGSIEKAREIRESGLDGASVAKLYGMSHTAAKNLLAGKTYKVYGMFPGAA